MSTLPSKILNTDRLDLLEFEINDAEFIIQLLNAPNWLQYIGDRQIRTKTDALKYIQTLKDSYLSNGFGLWKMVTSTNQTPLGMCGFVKRDYLAHPDIGFAILPEFEGKGYTVEASKAALEFGFEQLGFENIGGITDDGNLASQAVLRKIGLQFFGKVTPPGGKAELLYFETSKNTAT